MVKFTYDGTDYALGFNRKTAAAAQSAGLDIEKITTQPLVQIPELVFWAFKMNHPTIKRSKTEEIYGKIGDKTGLISALMEDYVATYQTLFDDNEDGGEGGENFIKWSSEK